MQPMRGGQPQAHERPVPADVPGVLHEAGHEHAPQQARCVCDAGRDRAHAGESWPGASLGVRGPMPGETALSWAEVHVGVKAGVL